MERPDVNQILGRLLGPAGPEVGCDVCFEELDRYVELELAAQMSTQPFPVCAHISTAARLAARSTRACERSSAASQPRSRRSLRRVVVR